MPLSRPKIHRLPAQRPLKSTKSPQLATAFALVLAVALLGLSLRPQVPSNVPETPEMAPAAAETKAPERVAASRDTIIIKENGQAIVGQMAKIPAAGEHGVEVSSISNVDKGTGRELLSIIDKY